MAILESAVETSQSSARAVLAGSVCHPDLDTDCHVVELLAMTNGRALLPLAPLQTVNNVRGQYTYTLSIASNPPSTAFPLNLTFSRYETEEGRLTAQDRMPQAGGFEMPASEPHMNGHHSLPSRAVLMRAISEDGCFFSYDAALCLPNVFNDA